MARKFGKLSTARTLLGIRNYKKILPEARVYWRALQDPRTPLWAKAAVAGAVGYAVLPVDLIPDFIPLGGWIDDAVVVPAIFGLAVKAIPPHVLADARAAAAAERPKSWREHFRAAKAKIPSFRGKRR
jgi:uncharacterized membrane protein YkvA (DUF1232 family)